MSDIELSVTINITNLKEFKQSAIDYGCKATDAMPAMVAKIAIEPDEAPSTHGYKIASVDVQKASSKTYVVVVGIDVENEEAMVKEAISCFSHQWKDDEWKPDTLGNAAFELLCGSNERPSPDTLGFEYFTWSYPKDRNVNPEFLVDPVEYEEDEKLVSVPGI